jgi:hypothetical protein
MIDAVEHELHSGCSKHSSLLLSFEDITDFQQDSAVDEVSTLWTSFGSMSIPAY